MRFPLSVMLLLGLAPGRLAPQEPFEIEVYPYMTAGLGEWELETHLNYARLGTTTFDGTVAPTQRQVRLAAELTWGMTDHWEVSGYLLGAHRPDLGFEFAGWRLRSRMRAPERWGLPVRMGFGVEFEGSRAAYSESARTLEVIAIFEKRLGPVQLTVDPTFEHDLAGPATDQGWEFGTKARAAVGVSRAVTLGLEYYGALGEVGEFLPAGRQVHQFYPSVDLRLGDDLAVNLGVGVGATNAGDRLVFKSRFEIPL